MACSTNDATFAVYGPFNYGGKFTSDSNAAFNEWLKQQYSEASGIRDFEAVDALCQQTSVCSWSLTMRCQPTTAHSCGSAAATLAAAVLRCSYVVLLARIDAQPLAGSGAVAAGTSRTR